MARYVATAPAMPPRAATRESTTRARSRSSPASSSLRGSRPMKKKKKKVNRRLFTQPRRSMAIAAPPTCTESSVRHTVA